MSRNESVPFQLLRNEELILAARPHPLAFLGLMLFWLFIAGLGAAHIHYRPIVMGAVLDPAPVGWLVSWVRQADFLVSHAYDVIWFASLLLPLVVMAVFRVNFGYVLTLLGLLAANFLLQWKVEPRLGLPAGTHAHLENYLLIAVGVIGVIGVEFFRRGHRYYLTTHRMVARFGSLKVSERSTLYSKIEDLVLQQGPLGKIFGFGTVIPITSTGLGMGQDLAIAGAQAGAGKGPLSAGLFAAGGKIQNVPRDLSIYVLYKIKNPAHARNLILQEMSARERPRAEA